MMNDLRVKSNGVTSGLIEKIAAANVNGYIIY